MNGSIEISVVAPCFNEEAVVEQFYLRMARVCGDLNRPYEIILVNDGSRDGTWQKMLDLAKQNTSLVCVNLSRNHGHQLALTAGLSVCRGDRVLIIDADLQDPPELLPKMLQKMSDESADVVYGQRDSRVGESAFKLLTASVFYRGIGWLADTPIPRDTGDFRLMSRRSLDALLKMNERHRFIRGMVSWIGFKQVPIHYKRDARAAGQTKYPFKRMLRFALDAVTSFSVKPLRMASVLGAATGSFAMMLIAYAVLSWLIGRAVSGWTSLMSVVAFLGSIQLLVLGVIGEYLGRLYEQSQGRPLFIIEQIVNGHPQRYTPSNEPEVHIRSTTRQQRSSVVTLNDNLSS